MGRNPNCRSSERSLVIEKELNSEYDRGWKDCKKAIIEVLNKTYDVPTTVEDLSNIIKIIEKV
jgi:hypothetical protein